jgi:DnaJ-class molecular chaperone
MTINEGKVWKCGRCNGTGKSKVGTSDVTCPDCKGSGIVEI